MDENELFGISEQLESSHFADPGKMVGDLISRQAAISHVDDVPYIKDHPNVGLLWKAWIESLPSAQPERKKGKWLPDNNNYYEERFICSVCGKSYKMDTCMGKPMWNFCPCGADMMEDGDGNG